MAELDDLRSAVDSLRVETQRSQQSLSELSYTFRRVDSTLGRAYGNLNTLGSAAENQFTKLSSVMGGLVSSVLPLFGSALSGAMGTLAASIDTTQKVFKELGQVGALNASGFAGLRDNINKSLMSQEAYLRVVQATSTSLARMRGNAFEGANAFAEISGRLIEANKDLYYLGYTADSMGEAMAGYIERQTRLGLSQNVSNEKLAAGSRAYLLELDALSKATGLSAKAIQTQQNEALNESRYRAQINRLLRTTGTRELVPGIQNFQTLLSTFKGDFAKGFRDLIGGEGTALTNEAQNLVKMSGGAIIPLIQEILSGQVTDQGEMFSRFQQAFAPMEQTNESIARFGKATTDFAGLADILAANYDKSTNKIILSQQTQLAGGLQADKELNEAQRQVTINMENLNRQLGVFATTVMPQFVQVMQVSIDFLMKGLILVFQKVGIPLPTTLGGAGGGGGGGGGGGPGPGPGPRTQIPSEMPPALASRLEALIGGRPNTNQGMVTEKLITAAEGLKKKYDGVTFTAFNDNYHREDPRYQGGAHTKGMAMDFVLPQLATMTRDQLPQAAADVVAFLKQQGLVNIFDGYTNSIGSGPHFHAEVSARQGFSGILSGPSSGYRPNITMHGEEMLQIKPMDSAQSSNTMTSAQYALDEIMTKQLGRLDDIADILRGQTGYTRKILRASY